MKRETTIKVAKGERITKGSAIYLNSKGEARTRYICFSCGKLKFLKDMNKRYDNENWNYVVCKNCKEQ